MGYDVAVLGLTRSGCSSLRASVHVVLAVLLLPRSLPPCRHVVVPAGSSTFPWVTPGNVLVYVDHARLVVARVPPRPPFFLLGSVVLAYPPSVARVVDFGIRHRLGRALFPLGILVVVQAPCRGAEVQVA